ncbi:hypothetical protein POM88_053551 [Heracleum sosnowskyi]|uniref:V-type proton ATPase proteolipid subunit n=1 Tax=Heracleum sosnowskyi TaxID=360622 RepID=A0AAD8GPX8_9APIA|nr:hypothetical protein POM88_053551 [Heracleum sosnowskyi]
MSTAFSGDETAPFFGFLGAAAALVFSCMGAAYGTAKSGVGVASMGVMRPELVMKSIVPVVMAGVLGIYGLIIAVIISTGINPKAKSYYLFDGYAHLSSGLACGLAGLSAGMAIGIVGDAGVRANAQQPKLFVGMILILIFAEALALYGLIVGIILSSQFSLLIDYSKWRNRTRGVNKTITRGRAIEKVAPEEDIILTAERARAMGKQELLGELSSHKLAGLASALVNKSVDGTEKEDDMKAYRAAREESIQDAELNTGDEVPSVLRKKLTKKMILCSKKEDGGCFISEPINM